MPAGQAVRVALEDVVRAVDAPGVAIAIVSGDSIVASGAAGMANLAHGIAMSPEGACNWFSMTKIATATAAMMLADRGRLDLEAPVSGYLGDLWPIGFAGSGAPSPEPQQRSADPASHSLGSPRGRSRAG
jgi:CubicO group peptidase (beta-lactamase class C family)